MRCNQGGPACTYLPSSPTKNMRCNEGGPAYAYPLTKKHEIQSKGFGMCLPPPSQGGPTYAYSSPSLSQKTWDVTRKSSTYANLVPQNKRVNEGGGGGRHMPTPTLIVTKKMKCHKGGWHMAIPSPTSFQNHEMQWCKFCLCPILLKNVYM
jgi:hypothetical protein